VVVDVRYCGVCGTDVHAFQSGDAYPPELCGHEWTGTVREVGPGVRGVRAGDRVSVAILPPCGDCPECRAGLTDSCRQAVRSLAGGDPVGSHHGGYAPAIAVSAARVTPVPDELSDEAAALIEPATVAYHGVRGSHLRLGDVAVVQGAGPIGLMALQWVRAGGAASVVVVERSPVRARLAASLGADAVASPGEEALDLVRARTGGLGADAVFECVGRPETIQSAADLVRRGGSLAVIGLSDRDAMIRPGVWLGKQLSVTCALAYHQAEFARCTSMMAAGRVLAEPLHTSTVGLSGLGISMAGLAGGAAGAQGLPDQVKVLVDPR
jgi:(R,R)-butanediol dehydrogenase/meso-butanediol dehydrogenase/diacetyl reductase